MNMKFAAQLNNEIKRISLKDLKLRDVKSPFNEDKLYDYMKIQQIRDGIQNEAGPMPNQTYFKEQESLGSVGVGANEAYFYKCVDSGRATPESQQHLVDISSEQHDSPRFEDLPEEDEYCEDQLQTQPAPESANFVEAVDEEDKNELTEDQDKQGDPSESLNNNELVEQQDIAENELEQDQQEQIEENEEFEEMPFEEKDIQSSAGKQRANQRPTYSYPMKDTEPEVEQEAEPAGNTVDEPNQEQEY